MVSTHRDKARVGTITSRMEHYLEWKDPYPLTVEQVGAGEASQDVCWQDCSPRVTFLDVFRTSLCLNRLMADHQEDTKVSAVPCST